MNTSGHFEDDDLAFYAMNQLAEPEASAVARYVAESEEARKRLAEVQARVALYAVTAVDLHPIPEGALERLMRRVAEEKKVTPSYRPMIAKEVTAATKGRLGARPVLPWIGWAAAAVLAIAAGKLYQDRAALHSMLAAQTGQVRHLSAETMDSFRERDALKVSVEEQAKRIEQLSVERSRGKNESDTLKVTAEGEAARLKEQTASEASAERESESLRGTVAAQAGQIAQLTTDAAKARAVLEVLTDRTSLRVTLTKPKSRAAPSGRATYLAGRGILVFLASDLAPLKANKVYQLWLMPQDGSKPIAAGTFTPDARGDASLVHTQLPHAVLAKGFSVTIENEGGAQTPTLPIVLAGAARA